MHSANIFPFFGVLKLRRTITQKINTHAYLIPSIIYIYLWALNSDPGLLSFSIQFEKWHATFLTSWRHCEERLDHKDQWIDLCIWERGWGFPYIGPISVIPFQAYITSIPLCSSKSLFWIFILALGHQAQLLTFILSSIYPKKSKMSIHCNMI